MNVLIVGGTGEERRAAAAAFHRASELRSGPLLEVNAATQGALFARALCDWLGVGETGPGENPLRGGARGTLFLDDVIALAPEAQRLMLELLRRRPAAGGGSECWCGRLVVGCAGDPGAAVAAGEFSASLFDCLDKVRVDLGRHAARRAA